MMLTTLNNLWPPFDVRHRISGEALRIKRMLVKPVFSTRGTKGMEIRTNYARTTISPRSEGGG